MEGASRQMAAPRIHEFFDRQIKEYARNRRELKPPAIRRLLETNIKYGTLQPPDDVDIRKIPSAKTIGRRLIEFRNQPEAEQHQYDWFYWPESMISNRLPWEASQALLELLDYLQVERDKRLDPSKLWVKEFIRPTVTEALWYWRLTLAAPAASMATRLDMAKWLSFDYGQPDKLQALMRAAEGSLAAKRYLVQIEKPPELPTALEAAVESHFAWVPVSEPEPEAKTRESRTHKKRLRKRGTK
jgi:hypothetical protein